MAKKYRFPLKRSPKSDPQQYRIYRMENEAIGARTFMRLSRKEIRRLIISVCRNYQAPPVALRFRPLGKWAAEWTSPNIITLNSQKGTARDLVTVTHELAHHVHYALGALPEQEDHGPEFMACHMSILDTVRVIPVEGMRAILAKYKIRYADPGTTNSLVKLRRAVKGKK